MSHVEDIAGRLDSELSRKAGRDQVDELLLLKADLGALAEKADLAHVEDLAGRLDSELSRKAGRDQVDELLLLKADLGALAEKADLAHVEDIAGRLGSELSRKADRDQVDQLLLLKADRLELESLAADISKGMSNIASLRRTWLEQERRLWMLIEEARKRMPEPFTPEQIGSFADEGEHLLDAFYVSFEDEFRGTREEIRERLRVYVPFLEQAGLGGPDSPVLDLGCGRGGMARVTQTT